MIRLSIEVAGGKAFSLEYETLEMVTAAGVLARSDVTDQLDRAYGDALAWLDRQGRRSVSPGAS
jgi:hypothetical protein